jgi:hypothetical protein
VERENKLEPKSRPKNTSKSDLSRKCNFEKKVENDRFFVARATPFARGNSDGIQMVGLRWFEYCID